MEFDVRIEVSQLPGILDPEGATVERSLPTMGWDNVRGVSIGKSIRLTIEAPSEDAARTQIDEMCRKLLANPVIESYEIHLREQQVLGAVTRAMRDSDNSKTAEEAPA